MGVDYSPLGGVGIEITNDIKRKLVMANEGETYDGDLDSLCSELDFSYGEAGDGNYTGEENSFYLMVEGKTLMEINENAPKFIEKLNSMNIKIGEEDLQIISELHVW